MVLLCAQDLPLLMLSQYVLLTLLFTIVIEYSHNGGGYDEQLETEYNSLSW